MKNAQRVLRTGDEIRSINRKRKMVVYSGENPTAPISREVRGYLSKKEELKDQMEGKEDWQDKLLDDLVIKIRGILTK